MANAKLESARKNSVKFFKEIRHELKKVIWPSRQQLVNNTVSVLVCCFLIGGIIWIADFGLDSLLRFVLRSY